MKPKKAARDFKWRADMHPLHRFFDKTVNSVLTPTGLWPSVIQDQDFDDLLTGATTNPVRARRNGGLRRALWFWPRIVEATVWTTAKTDPSPFRDMTPDSELLVRTVAECATGPDAPILDIGCNCGRHMAALADRGFTNLSGVDVNAEAIRVMPEWFPQLAEGCSAETDLLQRYLPRQESGKFDVIFTRGATIELIHPSFPLVREMCRVAREHVVLMIAENEQAYPRFWALEFLRQGFVLTHLVRPVQQSLAADEEIAAHVSLLVFRRYDSAKRF